MSYSVRSVMMLITLLLFLMAQPTLAQSDTPKTEIGVHFSYLSMGDFGLNLPPSNNFMDFTTAEKGIGGRLTYNFSRNIAVEGEINYFHNTRELSTFGGKTTFTYRKEPGIQGLFGPKIGFRKKWIGIFGKARPGFLHYKQPDRIEGFDPFNSGLLNREFRTNAGFALDLGGVVEVYPSRHTILRFDMGDTMTYHKTQIFNLDGTPVVNGFMNKFTQHNLQFSVGAGWRF